MNGIYYRDNYNWIDNNIAVGNNRSDYRDFDIIVNLDCPNNGVEHGSIDLECQNDKHIYRIGCYDSENENMEELIREVLPELLKIYTINPKIKILFHCRAGVSRSATLAISFLCASKNYMLSDAYNLVKSKRPIINPNNGFFRCLVKLFNYS